MMNLHLLRCAGHAPFDVLVIESEGHQGELSFSPEGTYYGIGGVMPARVSAHFYDVSVAELREMRVALNKAIDQMVHKRIKE